MIEPLKLGVIGLGRAFTLMLPTFTADPRIQLTAASDPRADARERFAHEFNAKSFEDAEALCADPDLSAVYIASPHQFHVAHVKLAAKYGKHALVEKPMALSVAECQEMIAAAREANITLLVGHSHSFDLPYLRARAMIRSGAYGHVRMINALNFTDFLYRPRRPEELDTSQGGGVVFSQAAHQVDIVRLLAQAKATSIRAFTGNWDAARSTEGAYSAQIKFADGSFASLTYSGYAHFDTDEFMGWWGELGQGRDGEASYGRARQNLLKASSVTEEIALKNARAYGTSGSDAFRIDGEIAHNHFGLVVASCEHADLRPLPHGVMVYGDKARHLDELPAPKIPRAEVVDELYAAAISGTPPLHSGEWGLATLEICLAILEAAKTGQEVELNNQV
ncbi:Gfo/Idh/MocA family protein [Bradyrhizobium erythrophlei]|uniref:4,5-dihydroxyphthalate dehydrogenase n=1 Tax=Bradyrhizobium erythrophlei TaxID=1437360 RepID=A0A1M7UF30_9BRAD|nr:Gfo/Idh/MocA family oxidoreductase [Bradyrhizobium erythrophlei]SHN81568.1 4,5-dihydroxyphthalate dehydrogenase [Bradyrhizobium erythrophlei]